MHFFPKLATFNFLSVLVLSSIPLCKKRFEVVEVFCRQIRNFRTVPTFISYNFVLLLRRRVVTGGELCRRRVVPAASCDRRRVVPAASCDRRRVVTGGEL